MAINEHRHAGPFVSTTLVHDLAPRKTAPQQRCRRKARSQLAILPAPAIPPSLELAACDPDGILDKLGILSAREFWNWYHAEDGPQGICLGHMGQKWGEFWYEFLQSDSLVLAGAVPLVLQKRAQMTGLSETQKIKIAEFRALQKLRERLEHLDMNSIGGLVITICGRVNINVQLGEFDLALMHLQAIRRLFDMQQPAGTTWICSVFTDLRAVSSMGSSPVLARHIPEDWRQQAPVLPPDAAQACQRSAMSNMRSLGLAGSDKFNMIYAAFKQLHELDITTATPADHEPPIAGLYNTIYDCCVLDAEHALSAKSHPVATQTSLLAICLKLCVWEQASRYVPRGGEIERHLLQRAKHLLGNHPIGHQTLSKIPGGANASALLWIFFTLTATAYMFQRDEVEGWIERLRAVTTLTTASAFQRSLKGWPCATWWLSHALRRICNELAPRKGQWRVLTDEPEPVPVFTTGLRLKLLVISS